MINVDFQSDRLFCVFIWTFKHRFTQPSLSISYSSAKQTPVKLVLSTDSTVVSAYEPVGVSQTRSTPQNLSRRPVRVKDRDWDRLTKDIHTNTLLGWGHISTQTSLSLSKVQHRYSESVPRPQTRWQDKPFTVSFLWSSSSKVHRK